MGVTVFDAADKGPGPRPLTATTLNVYAVPLVSPANTYEVFLPIEVTVVSAVAPE